jgi:hypothetical protein
MSTLTNGTAISLWANMESPFQWHVEDLASSVQRWHPGRRAHPPSAHGGGRSG